MSISLCDFVWTRRFYYTVIQGFCFFKVFPIGFIRLIGEVGGFVLGGGVHSMVQGF